MHYITLHYTAPDTKVFEVLNSDCFLAGSLEGNGIPNLNEANEWGDDIW